MTLPCSRTSQKSDSERVPSWASTIRHCRPPHPKRPSRFATVSRMTRYLQLVGRWCGVWSHSKLPIIENCMLEFQGRRPRYRSWQLECRRLECLPHLRVRKSVTVLDGWPLLLRLGVFLLDGLSRSVAVPDSTRRAGDSIKRLPKLGKSTGRRASCLP